jgi:amino acid transporter
MAIGSASVLAFFAFVGFEDMVNVAEEVQDPQRNMPRAITITLVVATLLYITVAAAVLFALPLQELSGAEAPLALLFRDSPSTVQAGFSAIAVVATVNGVLIQMVMASRVLYGMASRGRLPRVLAQISPMTRTPTVATVIVTGLILVLSGLLPIAALASGTSQVVLIVFVFVNISLIAMKLRETAASDSFTVPMIVPVLGALTSVGLLAISIA